jgi:hypothetical protein
MTAASVTLDDVFYGNAHAYSAQHSAAAPINPRFRPVAPDSRTPPVQSQSIMYKIVIAYFAFLALNGPASAQTATAAPMDHQKHMAAMADAAHQAEVAQRGKDVMPFDMKATAHIFTKNLAGGIQRVVAKKVSDAAQIKMVRQHLQEIKEQFGKGDFSGPTHIHGQDMPGLAELKAAKPGLIAIAYKDVKGGAELTYQTSDAKLVTALHKWFDAQLSDHGPDAMAGHAHGHHGTMPSPKTP